MDADDIRLALALLLEGFALYLAAMNGFNWVTCIRNEAKGVPERPSMVPAVSAVVGWLAFCTAPHAVRHWMWLAPALDIGNWAIVIGVLYGIPRAILTAKPASPAADDDETK